MDIDLPPKDYVSDRPKPREPFFGSGAPGAIAFVVSWIVTAGLIYYFTH